MTLLVLKEMKVAPFGLVVRELDVLLGAGFQKMMLGDGDSGPPAVLAHRAERFRSQQEGSQRSMESVGEYAEKFRKQREGLRRSMVSLEGEEAQRSGGTVSLLFLVGVQTLRGLLIGREYALGSWNSPRRKRCWEGGPDWVGLGAADEVRERETACRMGKLVLVLAVSGVLMLVALCCLASPRKRTILSDVRFLRLGMGCCALLLVLVDFGTSLGPSATNAGLTCARFACAAEDIAGNPSVEDRGLPRLA